jgi:hypothetical protein
MQLAVGARPDVRRATRIVDLEPGEPIRLDHLLALLAQGLVPGAGGAGGQQAQQQPEQRAGDVSGTRHLRNPPDWLAYAGRTPRVATVSPVLEKNRGGAPSSTPS